MNRLSPGELLERIMLGHETKGVEFKSPGERTNKSFLAKVAKAALGMANLRHGGLVVIGVAPAP